jgi:serine/threonine-protein kinase RsbW
MSAPEIQIERIPKLKHIVRITPSNCDDTQSMLESLQETFDSCLSKGDCRIILDFKNIHYPTSSLIALLIEATTRARRLNGDVKMVNVSHSAKNNLTTFTPISYLTLEKDEKYALEDFQDSASLEETIVPIEEIAEVPLIDKLEKSLEEIKEIEENEKDKDESGNHLRVKSVATNLYSICDFVTKFAERAGMDLKDIGKTKIAVYEACLNVIEHAYHSKADNWIDVWVDFDQHKFTIVVQDYGLGFEFEGKKRYDVMAAVDDRQTGGFGLYIIRRSMDEVDYQSDSKHGNRLTMVKYLN